MPKVVASYVGSGSILRSARLQEAVLTAYSEDFGKYARKTDHRYLQILFDRAPDFVGNRVKYAKIEPTVKNPDVVFKRTLQLLSRAGLIHPVHATSGDGLPLRAQKNEKKFKLILLDIGILQRAMGVDPTAVNPESLMQINNGALAEQFVGQELLGNLDPYLNRKLYFWEREKKGSEAEVDYLFGFHGQVYPIEVKAGKTGRLRSIKQFLLEKKSPFGIRISQHPLSYNDGILSIPLYMIAEIPRLVQEIKRDTGQA